MATITYMNPLKHGKFEAYKKFTATFLGPRKTEYMDLLKRYGLGGATVYYRKVGETEYVIVVHTNVSEDATQRLATWSDSKHPFDQWFNQQLLDLHDFKSIESSVQPELLFDFSL